MVQTVEIKNLDVTAYSGTVKTGYEKSYGVAIGAFQINSQSTGGGDWAAGVTVTSTASAARRASGGGTNIAFKTEMPSQFADSVNNAAGAADLGGQIAQAAQDLGTDFPGAVPDVGAVTPPAQAASSSSTSCDSTCIAAVVCIPLMVLFFAVMAILSCLGMIPGDPAPAAKTSAVRAPAVEMETNEEVEVEVVAPAAPLTPDEEYKKVFELFAKGGDVINTRSVADVLVAVGAPHDEDVDIEDENWNSEISYDEFAADDVPMEDRPVNHAAIQAILKHMETQGTV